MKIFQCQRCYQPTYFENTVCESCSASLGFLPDLHVLSALTDRKDGTWKALAHTVTPYRYCENRTHGVCNWLVPASDPNPLCLACQTNRTIPNLDDPARLEAWRKLENAKHRLIYGLLRLRLPLETKADAPERGFAFDFLSDDPLPAGERVMTGHDRGLITINLAEADPAHREKARAQMGEPYRTLIGHFRHEIGHYYWERLVQSDPKQLDGFRKLFGDDQADYGEALKSYYANGPRPDWRNSHLSAYASAHPWEDWAETWAHYLHLVDTLETAHAFGMSVKPALKKQKTLRMRAGFDPYLQPDFTSILDACLPLVYAVNSLNRGMGQPDLYPFVLPQPVVAKLRFIHRLCHVSAV